MNIQTLNDLPVGEAITMMVYGGSGKGKTFFVGTAGTRNAIINTGAGLTTLQAPAFRKLYPHYNPIVINLMEKLGPRGYADTATLFDAVCDAIDELIAKHRDKFDTISIDDSTALARGAMNKAIEINETLGKTKIVPAMDKFKINLPGVAEYGMEMELIEKFIAAYTDICKRENLNFIMTAHERLTYRKPSSIGDLPVLQSVRPGFTGSTFPDKIPAYFDEVWHFESKGEGDKWRSIARTRGNSTITAKSRHGGIFNELEENPDFLAMQLRIQKAYVVSSNTK